MSFLADWCDIANRTALPHAVMSNNRLACLRARVRQRGASIAFISARGEHGALAAVNVGSISTHYDPLRLGLLRHRSDASRCDCCYSESRGFLTARHEAGVTVADSETA